MILIALKKEDNFWTMLLEYTVMGKEDKKNVLFHVLSHLPDQHHKGEQQHDEECHLGCQASLSEA